MSDLRFSLDQVIQIVALFAGAILVVVSTVLVCLRADDILWVFVWLLSIVFQGFAFGWRASRRGGE